MIRRLAFILAATALLSGCSTLSGPEDLFGYANPQPGVLASAPGLVAVEPLPPAPEAARTGGALPLPPAAPSGAASPAPRGATLVSAPASAPLVRGPRAAGSALAAETDVEDGERDRMIAAALAPASGHQSLGELDRNDDGTLVLPVGRSLEIIDIAPIRQSMTSADDRSGGL
ncbi:hypothetical protein ASG43_20825 [Aureimonas sp. Leaf454]|uniref:hypothetical protein n=1 Tax=Aureimonas sp. Leaf454 TaxID=1736381 RepID=UPI0006F4713B|nr:hypothetical protein [Aureimonas sp. Leaf454]KQT51937.1 hypothetical protein ASG43_20825 [Aureimonas sp. Leaf454]